MGYNQEGEEGDEGKPASVWRGLGRGDWAWGIPALHRGERPRAPWVAVMTIA